MNGTIKRKCLSADVPSAAGFMCTKLVVVSTYSPVCSSSSVSRFIQYCKDCGGYMGVSYAEEEEDVVARLAALWTSVEPKGITPTNISTPTGQWVAGADRRGVPLPAGRC